MTSYSLAMLKPDDAIKLIKKRIDTSESSNVVKWSLAISVAAIEDAKKCQKLNIHRRVHDFVCSCALALQSRGEDDESMSFEQLFRSSGHIDHTTGQLTKAFVRKWPEAGLNSAFFCWWCVECGYLGEAKLNQNGKPIEDLGHECPSHRIRRELITELERCIVKPNTKPVVAGINSWNSAIAKAIGLAREIA